MYKGFKVCNSGLDSYFYLFIEFVCRNGLVLFKERCDFVILFLGNNFRFLVVCLVGVIIFELKFWIIV